MQRLALVANLLLLVYVFAAIVTAVRERERLRGYLPAALTLVVLTLGLDLLVYLITPANERLVPPGFYAAASLFLVLRVAAIGCIGLWSADRLGLHALPLTSSVRGSGGGPSAPTIFVLGIGTGLAIVAFSAALFALARPGSGAMFEHLPRAEAGAGDELSLTLVLLFAATTSLGEELTFRLGLQNWLAAAFDWRGGHYWIAVALSAALWSAGHIGMMDPDWVKLAQIFPAGLALGWLFRRAGFEACVIAHATLNTFMPYLTPLILEA